MYEEEFIQLYRMPQQLTLVLLGIISPEMQTTSIPKEIRMLSAISFLAEGKHLLLFMLFMLFMFVSFFLCERVALKR